jgi:hypothetical protein
MSQGKKSIFAGLAVAASLQRRRLAPSRAFHRTLRTSTKQRAFSASRLGSQLPACRYLSAMSTEA